MYVDEDTRAESLELRAAWRNGLVMCPHCHQMVEEELLGVTCEECGAEGCERCIVPGPDRRWTCVDPFDCAGR